MELFLLYLFTRLDAVKEIIHPFFVISIILTGVGIIAYTICNLVQDDCPLILKNYFLNALRTATTILIITTILQILLPTSKQLGIIVGGSLVIDAIHSPQVKEIGGLVYDAIKKQLEPSNETPKKQ